MNRIIRVSLLSAIFSIAFNLPIFFLKSGLLDHPYKIGFLEFSFLFPATTLLFYLISHLRKLGSIILGILFTFGSLSNFFVLSLKKAFDEGVLSDILSVELSLTLEYVNIYVGISVLVLLVFYTYLINRLIIKVKFDGTKIFIVSITILGIILTTISSITYRTTSSNLAKSVIKQYVPFSFFYATNSFIKNHKKYSDLIKNKTNLTSKYHFTLDNSTNTQEPLIVVFIIGESMRGDLVSEINTPKLLKRENLVIFKEAKSSSTSTNISLPYMLTSATPPNFDQALSEKSIISIFKHLGFDTSWIGNQGLFGVHEGSFASIALEADYVVARQQLEQIFSDKTICDECILPLFEEKLKNERSEISTGIKLDNSSTDDDPMKNKFFVLHLIGNHWNFDKRLPKNYQRKNIPYCNKSSVVECSMEELINSYMNSLNYTDEVIDQILDKLEDKKAVVFYASDHGFSLGEDGYFGNAYKGPNTPKEQLDIAMFVWASKKFIEENKSSFDSIKQNSQRSVSHDYLFHSILSCIGVKSDYLDDRLSFCKTN